MKLDRAFEREIKKEANGDGSRAARFAFLARAEEVQKRLSTYTGDVQQNFDDTLKECGRAVVGLCVAATIWRRRDRHSMKAVQWATEVLSLWANGPGDPGSISFNDGLHPTRVEVYAGELIRCTMEPSGTDKKETAREWLPYVVKRKWNLKGYKEVAETKTPGCHIEAYCAWESNPFANPRTANNGGGYSQPEGWAVVSLADGRTITIAYSDMSAGDFGTRKWATVNNETEGYTVRFSWGSMENREIDRQEMDELSNRLGIDAWALIQEVEQMVCEAV